MLSLIVPPFGTSIPIGALPAVDDARGVLGLLAPDLAVLPGSVLLHGTDVVAKPEALEKRCAVAASRSSRRT